jgi:hypothetical protein
MIKRWIVLAIVSLFALSACQSTGDSKTDASAAQSFFPTIANYSIQESSDLQGALSGVLTAASLSTGNIVAAPLVLKVDDILSCYRGVGAVDAKIYVENPGDQLIRDGIRLPIGGVLVVVNQSRVVGNFGSCVAGNRAFRAQSVTPEPCTGNGTFVFNNETLSYFYAATDTPLCDDFSRHFAQYTTS